MQESIDTPPLHEGLPVVPGAGIELPAPTPEAPVKRNQHLKVDEPKKFQFTGRATESESIRINALLTAQGGDIVRTVLKMLDYIEADFLQTFKTK